MNQLNTRREHRYIGKVLTDEGTERTDTVPRWSVRVGESAEAIAKWFNDAWAGRDTTGVILIYKTLDLTDECQSNIAALLRYGASQAPLVRTVEDGRLLVAGRLVAVAALQPVARPGWDGKVHSV